MGNWRITFYAYLVYDYVLSSDLNKRTYLLSGYYCCRQKFVWRKWHLPRTLQKWRRTYVQSSWRHVDAQAEHMLQYILAQWRITWQAFDGRTTHNCDGAWLNWRRCLTHMMPGFAAHALGLSKGYVFWTGVFMSTLCKLLRQQHTFLLTREKSNADGNCMSRKSVKII